MYVCVCNLTLCSTAHEYVKRDINHKCHIHMLCTCAYNHTLGSATCTYVRKDNNMSIKHRCSVICICYICVRFISHHFLPQTNMSKETPA